MSPHRPPTHGRRAIATAAVLAALGVAFAGCGGSAPETPPGETHPVLASGRAAADRPGPAAVRLARRFARSYARHAYLRRPAFRRSESPAVRGALHAAAGRVPAVRRTLRPRLLGLALSMTARGALAGTAWIGDRRFPPFSVGFTVSRRSGRWLVTSVSLPD